jgi:hypothetical protein
VYDETYSLCISWSKTFKDYSQYPIGTGNSRTDFIELDSSVCDPTSFATSTNYLGGRLCIQGVHIAYAYLGGMLCIREMHILCAQRDMNLAMIHRGIHSVYVS